MCPSRAIVGSVLAAIVCVPLVLGGVPAALADDGHSWTSLFDSGPYAGAGWTRCPEPIHISIDTRQLKHSQVGTARRALLGALRHWNASRTVTFAYGGEIPVHFDPATGVSRPEDGVARDRWIYVTLVKGRKSAGPDSQVVGLAGPLRIDPATDTILEGSAAFQAAYVNSESIARVELLLAHELGHVFGLGHSTSKKDIMYPILHDQTKLGPGDIAGIWAILKPCPAVTAADATPAA